ncbi:outer membrane lipoprotein-sorting protein [Enterobacteriaceae bacterium ESL0689]|nr:outer membrane lipoprotein-sorting protein [Enterobacteriaceae bacterium ESL0689]
MTECKPRLFSLCSTTLLASIFMLNTELFAAPLPEVKSCNDVLLGVQHRYHGYNSWRMIKMDITDEHGNVKSRTITATHKNNGINRILRSRVVAPPELANAESYVLDYTEDDQKDRIWRYLPASQKLLEVQSKDLSSRLYGSDMNIGEMMTRMARDYDCQLLSEGEYQGLPVYKIHVEPNNEQELLRLGLKDGEIWVEKGTFLPVYSIFNAEAPNEQRIFETSNQRWVDGIFVAEKYQISTLKDGRKVSQSAFQVYGESFNLSLPESWYDVQDLGNEQSTWREYRSPNYHLETLP